MATERMALTSSGHARCALKTRTATAPRFVIEPLDFMARLAALVPPPRIARITFACGAQRLLPPTPTALYLVTELLQLTVPAQLEHSLCGINTDHSTNHLGPSGCL